MSRLTRQSRSTARRSSSFLLGTGGLAALLCAATLSAQAPRPVPGLTAFRPQYGAGYAPFARTAVPDALEMDALLGPGIRANGAGEFDPFGEDDLIELVVDRAGVGGAFVLSRTSPVLAVWTTRDKAAGTELAFTGDVTAPIQFGGAQQATLWVEWTGAAGGDAILALQAQVARRPYGRVRFHCFRGLVVALGGEDQVPQLPVDPNHGTYIVATELYELGWDVLMSDEDFVSSSGAGAVYDEMVNAIQYRGVDELAIFGYSHGGGSTYDLCERLSTVGAGLPSHTIEFTSYVDGVGNNSDIDTSQETRRPIGSAYHANHYQHGSFFQDLGLDGGPVTNSLPPPTGLDVETTPWGASATHFVVDDYAQVVDFILVNLEARLAR
ncbi:MAG: hypothetical protein H6831_15970 [Planctomycetes bacterium]|nr:hypothetical protein [Planctomycetota bacterium]MCB9905897.1 hypothetical protein [Planctomycetota bacterium]